MTEAKEHKGGCHCGKVRYRVNMALDKAISCNCSICSKKGYLLSFVPAAAFVLENGQEALTDYQFNKHVIHHLFCSSCGIESFANGEGPDGSKMVAVNVRCLDDVDLSKLQLSEFDGRSM